MRSITAYVWTVVFALICAFGDPLLRHVAAGCALVLAPMIVEELRRCERIQFLTTVIRSAAVGADSTARSPDAPAASPPGER